MRRAASKYRAKPTTVDGIRFHSQKEARRYGELKLLEKAGEISNLERQPKFVLNADDGYMGAFLGYYVADFSYWDTKGGVVIEDVKGFRTPLYKWKKRHVEAQYGIKVLET